MRFLARGAGYGIFLTGSDVVLALPGLSPSDAAAREPAAPTTDRVRLHFANSVPAARMAADGELPGTSNYYRSNERDRWRTQVKNYARVRAEGIYDGVDMVFYGNQRQLEYDFIVAPGADPGAILLDVDGALPAIDAAGDLVLTTASRRLVQKKPVAYQDVNGRRRPVQARYVFREHRRVAIRVADFDRSRPLVIDPAIGWSTFLGGGIGQGDSFNADDFAEAVAVDASGNVYVAGFTTATDFPTLQAYQPTSKLSYEAFVAKIATVGETPSLSYSTYLGGSSNEEAAAVAVDANGHASIAGYTQSVDFPTLNAPDAYHQTLHGPSDAFVATFDSTGQLSFSALFGGSGDDAAKGVAVDATGIYVAGDAGTGFPTTNGALHTTNATYGGFAIKVAGNQVAYSTYLSSDGSSYGVGGIATDGSGAAYIATGRFVAKLAAAGDAFTYSTALTGAVTPFAIAVDGVGNAYVAGSVSSANLATPGALQTSLAGSPDAFVMKLGGGGSLVYFTYLGGTGPDYAFGIALDVDGNAYVTGETISGDFPVANAIYPAPASAPRTGDAFVSRVSADGSTLDWSTYLGGTFRDKGQAIAVDASRNVYVAGWANSGNFPTRNGLQSFHGNVADAFITKIRQGLPQTITVTAEPPATAPYNSTFSVSATSSAGLPVTIGASDSCAVSSGGTTVATIVITSGTGTCSITFDQPGDATYEPAPQVKRTVTADKALAAVVLTSDQNPAAVGQTVGFSATVIPLYGGSVSGLVTFYEGATVLGSSVVVGDTATFATAALGFGAHQLTATYEGDTNLAANTSNVLTEYVGDVADLSVTLTATPAQVPKGSNVTLTAVVQNLGPTNATTAFARLQLPAGLAFVSAAPAADYDPATGGWTIGSLASGAVVSLQVVATVTAEGPLVTAQIVSADQLDSNPANNAATLTVLEPGIYVDATCSLRSAIVAANTDAPFGGCPAGRPGLDRIFLPPGSTHEYSDVYEDAGFGPDALPAITTPIALEGRGAIVGRMALAGTPAMRIFFVKVGGALTLHDVTVRNGADDAGYGGAGVLLEDAGASLTVDSSRIVGNASSMAGGGIVSRPEGGGGSGDVVVTNSVIAGNYGKYFGGGIASTGTCSLTITNSVIGPATVNGVAYPGNAASTDAIDAGFGGGIWAANSSTVITGGSISGNTATNGGGLFNGGYATLRNVTVSGNHSSLSFAGIDNRGSVLVTGSTITGNSAGGSGGGIANLFQNYVGPDGGLTLVDSVVARNTAAFNAGGINTYGPATLTNTTVGGATDADGNVADLAGGGIFVRNGASLTMTGGAIGHNAAKGAPNTDGGGGGVFNAAGGTVNLLNVTVGNNRAVNGDGGGVFSQGLLVLGGGLVNANNAWNGAGIANGNLTLPGGDVLLTDATITANVANGLGGGLSVSGGSATLERGEMSDNSASWGGGIYTHAAFTWVTNTFVSRNTAAVSGGGITLSDGTLWLIGATVADNANPTAGITAGGGLSLYGSAGTGAAALVASSTISGNTGNQAGGIGVIETSVTILDSTISGNSGTNASGALEVANAGGTVQLTDSTIANNLGASEIYSPPGAIHARNSIVFGGCYPGSVVSDGFNVFGAGSACPSGGTDISIDPTAVFTDLLAPLADNGGPTKTHALLASSPAIDAGAADCGSVDQRQAPRPVDGNGDTVTRCDIGAFEYGSQPGGAPATHFSVSAPASAIAGTPFTVVITALDAANVTATAYSGIVHVTSSDGAATLPADTSLVNGTGTFAATLQTTGGQTITATDTAAPSISGTSGTIAVSQAVGAVTHFLVGAPASATSGSALNVTVTALDAANNTVTAYVGTVHFTSTDALATLPADTTLVNGTGTFAATLRGAGNQTITAVDTSDGAVTGTSLPILVSVVVSPPAVTMSFAPSAIDVGAVSTLTLSFTNPNGTSSLTGLALFDSFPAGLVVAASPNPANSCGGTLTVQPGASSVAMSDGMLAANGSCAFSVDVTPSSTGSFVNTTGAVTSANGGAGNTASAALTVNAAATVTVVASSPNPSIVGQSVTVTATVTGFNPGGTVTFFDGASVLSAVPLNAGKASVTTTALSAGSHAITARYSGDTNNIASTSTVLTQVVNAVSPVATVTTLSSSPNPSITGQIVTFTATVTGVNPTGTITFRDGNTVIGIVPLSGGVATLATSGLKKGATQITAAYSGDSGNQASTSSKLKQQVR